MLVKFNHAKRINSTLGSSPCLSNPYGFQVLISPNLTIKECSHLSSLQKKEECGHFLQRKSHVDSFRKVLMASVPKSESIEFLLIQEYFVKLVLMVLITSNH